MSRVWMAATFLAIAASAVGASDCTPGDTDGDADVDFADFRVLQLCYAGPGTAAGTGCGDVDLDGDTDVDADDFAAFGSLVTSPISRFSYGPSPRPDVEAEQLALENGVTLLATNAQYDRIRRDLAAIRDIEPLVESVKHDGRWVPTQMIVKVTDGVPTCGFDALNVFYGVTEVAFLFHSGNGTWYVVHFPGRLKIPRLTSEYSALDEVQFAESDDLVGIDDLIDVGITGGPDGTWSYDVDDGSVDCFDGCDCHLFWEFEVTGDGVATFSALDCVEGILPCDFPPVCNQE